ncbi:MAG TPA: diacylglycerol kinase family protein [Urbifossiella sp.]|jgi:diacylglycerol kinase (ATP)|nr:diacylglycerol kinase family protein [Urbifossiella sp.]
MGESMKPAAGRVCLLHNPQAGAAGQLVLVRDRLVAAGVEVRELAAGEDMADLARRAADDGFDTVVVAGGDGTVHAAANGLMTAARKATLALLPLGTGNDLCRTMGIPLDPIEAASLVHTGTPRDIDAARIDGGPGGYLVNAATGGFSGAVAAGVTSDLKSAWGSLAYLRGAVGRLADPPAYHLTLRFDDGPAEQFDVLNVVVANARTAAGGFPVAPTADPEDGLLDVVLVHTGSALDLSVVAARLMHGNYTHDENVTHRRARRVEITSDPPLPLSLDGERCECGRIAFTVIPGALRVLAGPDYQPRMESEPAVEAEPELVARDTRRSPGLAARVFGLIAGALLLVKRAPGWATAGLGLAALATLLFAWIARGVASDEWRAWDDSVLLALHAAASPDLDRLAVSVTRLGDAPGTAVLTLGLLAGFLWRKH